MKGFGGLIGPSLRGVRGGTQAGTCSWRNDAVACYLTQPKATYSGNGAAHSGLDPLASIRNQDNSPQVYYWPVDIGGPSTETCFLGRL